MSRVSIIIYLVLALGCSVFAGWKDALKGATKFVGDVANEIVVVTNTANKSVQESSIQNGSTNVVKAQQQGTDVLVSNSVVNAISKSKEVICQRSGEKAYKELQWGDSVDCLKDLISKNEFYQNYTVIEENPLVKVAFTDSDKIVALGISKQVGLASFILVFPSDRDVFDALKKRYNASYGVATEKLEKSFALRGCLGGILVPQTRFDVFKKSYIWEDAISEVTLSDSSVDHIKHRVVGDEDWVVSSDQSLLFNQVSSADREKIVDEFKNVSEENLRPQALGASILAGTVCNEDDALSGGANSLGLGAMSASLNGMTIEEASVDAFEQATKQNQFKLKVKNKQLSLIARQEQDEYELRERQEKLAEQKSLEEQRAGEINSEIDF